MQWEREEEMGEYGEAKNNYSVLRNKLIVHSQKIKELVKFKPCCELHSTGNDISHSDTVLEKIHRSVSQYWTRYIAHSHSI